MKLKFILGIISVILFLIFCVLKCFSTFVVHPSDGDNDSKMILLSKNYFYDEIEMSIWQYEKKTDCYLNVIPSRVDSLSYNNDYIVGYANKQYFIIYVKNNNIEYLNELVDKVEFKSLLFKNISEVTPLL